ncbi:hypothetical protein HanPI659440_Chr08g0310021 [Helianthus annuus]|nr:hypothetical protein HanPI659440_Chr08g0310021 [Helianthus annuus]
MSFPLYNSPLVQKRTGCTPLRGVVFLLKKKKKRKQKTDWLIQAWGPPSLFLLFGD